MRKIALNVTETGECRTILATYNKVGVYNVLEHKFPAVIEIDDVEDNNSRKNR